MSALRKEFLDSQHWSPPGDEWPQWSSFGLLTTSGSKDPIDIAQAELLTQAQESGYNKESQDFIDYCTHLARAHDVNEDETKRNRTFDKTPYVTHPFEMAQEAISMGLHPSIVAGCLVHDLPEDVKLGKLQSPEDWMKFLEGHAFATYPDKDRLMRILRAELKTESFSKKFQDETEREKYIKYYMDTPIGRTAFNYLQDLRGQPNLELTAKDSERIAEVVYDLHRLFADSYIVENGQKVFDPSMLTVKILDTWQNLKTPGFWKNQLQNEDKDAQTVAKLIRARTLTNVAEFLGMRKVASEMTMSLTAIQDTQNVDRPLLHELVHDDNGHANSRYVDRQRQLLTQLDQAHDSSKFIRRMVEMGHFGNRTPEARFQTPWAAQYPSVASSDSAGLGNIVYYVPSDPTQPSRPNRVHVDGYSISDKPLTMQDGAMRAKIQTLYGRETSDWGINYDFWPKTYRLRIEDAKKPRYTAAMRAEEFHPAQKKTSQKGIYFIQISANIWDQ